MVLVPAAPLRLRELAAWVFAAALLPLRIEAATCPPVSPVACPNCFAVFIMPDTQLYTDLVHQPFGASHLDLVTRYICDHRSAWTEPSTGKVMPILMVTHLGDLVQSGDRTEAVAGPLAEWARVDAAFDNLDACIPAVPYIVTLGNHDLKGKVYEGLSNGYQTYFGTDRWTNSGYGCADPSDCDWDAGEWFIGGGDPISSNVRNNVGEGTTGPAALQAGRHRAAIIRTPRGDPLLFLALEMAFDFPPPEPGFELVEGDDSAWPKQVLADYTGVATIAVHHSMLWAYPGQPGVLRWGPETWHGDSLTELPEDFDPNVDPVVGAMEDLWKEMVEPFDQIFMLLTGHVLLPTHQADYTIPRGGKQDVHGVLRNYQWFEDGATRPYGGGWNAVAVFDPDVGEIRIRSYRIDDTDAYADPPIDHDHTGTPDATECFDMDHQGFGERTIQWSFPPPPAAPGVPIAGMIVLGAGLVLAATRRLR